MTDFADLRKNMVEHQLRTNDVTSSAVLDRFEQLAREIFVPEDRRAFAYTDSDVQVWNNGSGERRYLMAPGIPPRSWQGSANLLWL